MNKQDLKSYFDSMRRYHSASYMIWYTTSGCNSIYYSKQTKLKYNTLYFQSNGIVKGIFYFGQDVEVQYEKMAKFFDDKD